MKIQLSISFKYNYALCISISSFKILMISWFRSGQQKSLIIFGNEWTLLLIRFKCKQWFQQLLTCFLTLLIFFFFLVQKHYSHLKAKETKSNFKVSLEVLLVWYHRSKVLHGERCVEIHSLSSTICIVPYPPCPPPPQMGKLRKGRRPCYRSSGSASLTATYGGLGVPKTRGFWSTSLLS